MSLGFGIRARVGQLYPSGGLCDYEIQLMAPPGVQFVTTRVPFRKTGVADGQAFAKAAATHSVLLADAGVELIAVNCTAATMVAGSENVRRSVLDHSGVAAVTTIDAVLYALDALATTRVALVTPYPEEVVRAETDHLAGHGLTVVTSAGLPRSTPVEQGEIVPERWLDVIDGLALDGIDAILVSCAGVQIAPVIDVIEAKTGLPVITSNQALLWWILEVLDLPDRVMGHGRLLAERPATPRGLSAARQQRPGPG